jgi:hypothetical protein
MARTTAVLEDDRYGSTRAYAPLVLSVGRRIEVNVVVEGWDERWVVWTAREGKALTTGGKSHLVGSEAFGARSQKV